ncbi:MaoC/PaaZ C-terminal domain-containing protein [Chloroflexota bacterium]
MSDPIIQPESLEVGAELPALSFGPVTSEHLVRWVAASEDFHAIHYDKDFAMNQGLPGVIMQGPFKLALFERQLVNILGESGRIVSISCTYSNTDVLGAILTFHAHVTEIEFANGEYRINLDLKTENEKTVVTVGGKAVVAVKPRNSLPSDNEATV